MLGYEDVKKIAALSMLQLQEEELDRYLAEMDSIVAFADQVQSAPVEDFITEDGHDAVVNYREDVAKESAASDEITRNAANQDFGYISVLKRE